MGGREEEGEGETRRAGVNRGSEGGREEGSERGMEGGTCRRNRGR